MATTLFPPFAQTSIDTPPRPKLAHTDKIFYRGHVESNTPFKKNTTSGIEKSLSKYEKIKSSMPHHFVMLNRIKSALRSEYNKQNHYLNTNP